MDEKLVRELKFGSNGIIPVVVQDYKSGEVLMLAYMNEESLKKTLGTRMAHYWSRSREKLWKKGETSGNLQYVKSIHTDCDKDTILLKVLQKGVACHTGSRTCFFREIEKDTDKAGDNCIIIENKNIEDGKSEGVEILKELYDVILDRKRYPQKDSYTCYLLEEGLDKILKKVGEEAAEVIIAAKNMSFKELRYEISDLLYHVLVLMVEQGLELEDIYKELKERR